MLLVALCAFAHNAQGAEIKTLTLDQALSIAMEKNRNIVKAREYGKYVQGKYVEERAAALPQFSISGGGIYKELVKIAESNNKPRIDLKGGAGWHWLDVTAPGVNRAASGEAWNIGVYLTFPFFDGLRTSGLVAQAKSDLKTKEIEELSLLDSVALEVRNACNAVRESGEIVSALGGTVKQAEKLLQMAEKGYEYGVKIRLEVDDAQLNLLHAKSSLARAQRDYRVAVVNYLWATGIAGE